MNTILNASRGAKRDTSSFTPALVACLMAGASAGGVYAQAGPGEPRVIRPAQGQVVQPKVAGPAIVHPLAIVPIPKEDPLAATYKPWEGKKIIIRRMGTPARYADMKGRQVVEVTNYSIVSTVIMYDRGNLEVRTGTGTAWFSPDQVLLVEDALPFFNERLQQNRYDHGTYALRAFVWAELGEWENAKLDAARAVQLAKGSSDYTARLYNQAWVYQQANEPEKAAECYTAILERDSGRKRDPRAGSALRERGLLHNQFGRHEAAVKDLTEAIALDSEDVHAHLGLADARAALGDYDGAVRAANFAVKYSFWKGGPLARKALIAARMGDFEMALSDANEAVKLETTAAWAVNDRGLVHLMANDLGKAETDFKAALKLNPKAGYAVRNLGEVELRRRNFDKADELFAEALRLSPGHVPTVIARGWGRYLARDYVQAVREFEKAAALSPAHYLPHANLSLCWLAQGMTNKSEDALYRAVELVPGPTEKTQAAPKVRTAELREQKGLDTTVERPMPRSAFVLAVRARLHAERAKDEFAFEFAVEDAAAAVRLDPRNEFALNTQAWLWATAPDEKLRNGKKAVALATKLVERSKGLDPEHLETLAAAYAEAGEFDKAVESQLKAIRGYDITPAQVEKCREQLVKQDGPLVETWELLLVARLSGYERKIPHRLPVPTIGGGLRGSLGRF